MKKSPGHQKWPDHRVEEVPLRNQHVEASLDGEVLAASEDVLKVEEDKHQPRYYFFRSDVRMDKLIPSSTTSECPFKGTATYFHLMAGGRKIEDVVWAYDEPYEEHAGLQGRLAFYEENLPGFKLTGL